MNHSRSFGLTGRLYAAVVLVILAMAGTSFFTVVQLSKIDAAVARGSLVLIPQLNRMAAIELNITRVSLQVRHAMLSRTPEELASTLAEIGRLKTTVDDLVVNFEKNVSSEIGRQRAQDIKTAMSHFWEVGGQNIAKINAGDKAGAFAFLVEKTIPARNALLMQLSETVKYQEGLLSRKITEVRGPASNLRTVVIGTGIAIGLGLMLLAWYIGSGLHRRVQEARETAERVRDGDFTQQVHDTSSDEFSPLIAAMSGMQTTLAKMVAEVRGNAESLATASAQIAQGNLDLSQRTEQQASALEQTAATMEELGTTVRQNADNALNADQLAKGASSVAIKGGEVVEQVVHTMKGISESSKKISDIIGTIDGIAFQTNILALNAAVEAARAGEQGRGFAVVASEVRSLAQRSAEAAKEIKSLIGASVERVDQGTALVDQAGQTMNEVVSSIRRVTEIVGEISSASSEQSNGIAQVSQAVSQMDQVTQQNAALVEESAAAAESLKSQACAMVQLMSVFKLKQGEPLRHAPQDIGANERRSPARAKNVARPTFSKKPAAPAVAGLLAKPSIVGLSPEPKPNKTGTDDDWASF